MDAYEAIITRRSTRKYKPDAVAPEQLQKIIEAGRYAPSGGNNQTNHFLVIQNADILNKITSLAEAAFAKMTVDENTYPSLRNSILASKKGGYIFSYRAPVLIIVANRKEYGNNMADSVAAIENMMIAANSLDLGSCYINQLYWLNEEPSLLSYLRELGLKEDERVYASMVLGHAATEDGLPHRKPLERKGNEVTII